MTDVVSGGAEATSRSVRGLLVVLAALAVVGLVVDRSWAQGEREQLDRAVAAGERTVAEAESSLIGLRQYLAPSAERADLPSAERTRAYAPLGRDAERWLRRVGTRLADVRDVRVLPWHDQTQRARDDAAARLQDAADRLADVARAPGG